jgi:stage II sporulation protein AA (anti-sigma F factor antagonist)
MRMLITAYERAGAAGSTLRVIVTPDSSVARTMTILGIDTVVPVHASIQDAMTAQAPGRAAARG